MKNEIKFALSPILATPPCFLLKIDSFIWLKVKFYFCRCHPSRPAELGYTRTHSSSVGVHGCRVPPSAVQSDDPRRAEPSRRKWYRWLVGWQFPRKPAASIFPENLTAHPHRFIPAIPPTSNKPRPCRAELQSFTKHQHLTDYRESRATLVCRDFLLRRSRRLAL